MRVLGFRGPLGAFIAAWGGITMLTSAPFDDWWHNAYGLDVKILSPPHVLLAIGIGAIHVGALIFVLGRMNRVEGRARQVLTMAFLFVSAMLLLAVMTLFMERTVRPLMHSAPFYGIVAAIAPLILCAASRGSGHRWGATLAAAFYSLFLLGAAVGDAAGAGAAEAGAGDDPGDQPGAAGVPAAADYPRDRDRSAGGARRRAAGRAGNWRR